MSSVMSTRHIEKELIARGLVPDGCRLLEVSIGVNTPLVVRYEVFVKADQLDMLADALKAAASAALADNERNRAAIKGSVA